MGAGFLDRSDRVNSQEPQKAILLISLVFQPTSCTLFRIVAGLLGKRYAGCSYKGQCHRGESHPVLPDQVKPLEWILWSHPREQLALGDLVILIGFKTTRMWSEELVELEHGRGYSAWRG